MDIQKEREAFEAWHYEQYLLENPNIDISNAKYIYDYAHKNALVCQLKESHFTAWQAAKAQAVPEGFVLVKDKPVAYMVQNNFWEGEFEVKLSSEMPAPEFKGDSYDIEIPLYAIETQEPANTDLTADFQTWFKSQPFYEKLIYQHGDRLFDRDGEVYRAQTVDIAYRAYKRMSGNE